LISIFIRGFRRLMNFWLASRSFKRQSTRVTNQHTNYDEPAYTLGHSPTWMAEKIVFCPSTCSQSCKCHCWVKPAICVTDEDPSQNNLSFRTDCGSFLSQMLFNMPWLGEDKSVICLHFCVWRHYLVRTSSLMSKNAGNETRAQFC